MKSIHSRNHVWLLKAWILGVHTLHTNLHSCSDGGDDIFDISYMTKLRILICYHFIMDNLAIPTSLLLLSWTGGFHKFKSNSTMIQPPPINSKLMVLTISLFHAVRSYGEVCVVWRGMCCYWFIFICLVKWFYLKILVI